MQWTVLLDTAFEEEFADLAEEVQDVLLSHAKLLEIFGPQLGRPRVDTLKGSKHANMKELRFNAAGRVWRVAFAFDLRAVPSCWWQETRRVAVRNASTNSSFKKADERFDSYRK